MKAVDLGCGTGYNTMGLARLVGGSGRVLAVDVQPGALDRVKKRAVGQGLGNIVETRLIDTDHPAPLPAADFALAFWMAHEVPDFERFFAWVYEALNPGGRLLVAEPPFHVKKATLESELRAAEKAGFKLAGRPRIRLCLTMLLHKPE